MSFGPCSATTRPTRNRPLPHGLSLLDNSIELPSAPVRAIGGFSWASREDDIRGDMPLRLVLRPRPRDPQRAAVAQTRHQIAFERAAALDEQ